jgi:hypothetical protein
MSIRVDDLHPVNLIPREAVAPAQSPGGTGLLFFQGVLARAKALPPTLVNFNLLRPEQLRSRTSEMTEEYPSAGRPIDEVAADDDSLQVEQD